VAGNVHTPANQNFSWKIDRGAIIAALLRKALTLGRHFATPFARISSAFKILAITRNYRRSRRQIPICASAPMATGAYREEQPNGYYFDEPCKVRQIVAVPSGGFAVTFMKAFNFNRLQFYGRDSVGG